MDWKTGTTHNFNGLFATPALTAGPSTTSYTVPDNATSNYAGSAAVTLNDGSVFLLTASRNGSASNDLIGYKYSSKGTLIAKVVLIGTATTNTIGNLGAVLLSNGNIAITYSVSNTQAWYSLITPGLQVLATGGVYSGQATVYSMQPTNNGGVLFQHGNGISFVSSTGSIGLLTANAAAVALVGLVDDYNNQSMLADSMSTPNYGVFVNNSPVTLANGAGFGYVYTISNTVYYTQVNADGTLGISQVTLGTMTGSGQLKYAYSPLTGNILWAGIFQSTSIYGIVNQNGTIVKSSATFSATGHQYSACLFTLCDAGGNFNILYSAVGGNWGYMRMSPTGTGITTNSNIGTWGYSQRATAIKVSTGIILVFGGAQTSYTYSYNYINLAGTVVVSGGLVYNFATGNGAQCHSLAVINDTVYGVCTAGAGGNTDCAVFSITNAGVCTVLAATTGVTFVVTSAPRLLVDSSNQFFHVVGSSASQTSITTYDLNLNQLQSYTIANVLANAHIKNFGYGFLFCDFVGPSGSSNSFVSTTPGTAAIFVKNKATVLLGTAASNVSAGQPLIVNTKGLFPTSSSWKTAAATFDHSSNNPNGNKGWINNNMINLAGF
jgi:hypothetical protein